MMRGSSKFISFGITSVIIMLLIFTGPAQAFNLSLSILDKKVALGNKVVMKVYSEPEEGDQVILKNFILSIKGPTDILCEFDSDAKIISGCEGITITKLDNEPNPYGYSYGYSYGYGYGYSYGYSYESGKREFKKVLDTDNLSTGEYKAEISTESNNNTYLSKSSFIILTRDESIRGCSFRGEDGILEVNGFLTSNNKLNLNIANKKAVNSKGYLYSQVGKNRISYKFKIESIISNSDEKAEILVDGNYKIGRNGKINEEVIITLDKVNNKIYADGDTISIKDMEIKFIKNC